MATGDYLQQLRISPEERAKLAGLGASTPAALLGMIRASREAFENFFGAERTGALADKLDSMLTAEERAILEKPPVRFALGALDPHATPRRGDQ